MSTRTFLVRVLSPLTIGGLLLAGLTVGGIVLYRNVTDPARIERRETAKPILSAAEADRLHIEVVQLKSDLTAKFEELARKVAILESHSSQGKGCETASLVVRSPFKHDRLFIDGKDVGETGSSEHTVCAGTVDVRVEIDGKVAYSATETLRPGDRKTIPSNLVRIP